MPRHAAFTPADDHGLPPAPTRATLRTPPPRFRPARSRVAVLAVASLLAFVPALPAYATETSTASASLLAPGVSSEHTDTGIQTFEAKGSQSLEGLDRSVSSTAKQATATTSSLGICRIQGLDDTGKLVFPLPDGTWEATSGVGYRYISSLGISDYHTGQDYSADAGTSILSMTDGTVIDVGTTEGAWYITVHTELPDGEILDISYVHMYQSGVLVAEGDQVHAGEEIGLVGASGIATGPHLHLEMHDASGGTTVLADTSTLIDPAAWIASHDVTSPGGC